MKKIIPIFLIFFLFNVSPLWPQEDDIIKETVDVINIEVPVRVYHKGKPVDNLSKNDFRLYEGKKLQKINGFSIKRKKIKIQELELSAEQKQSYAPRYFVLVFRLTHFHDDFKKGLSHIFNSILRKNDQLMVFVNNKSRYFNNLQNKNEVNGDIEDLIETESRRKRNQMIVYLKQIEQELDITRFRMELQGLGIGAGSAEQKHYQINAFLSKYLEIWNDYKKKYLIPNIENYFYFSKHLEKIKMDKWVLSFYQMELFPKIVLTGSIIRKIRRLVGQWQISSNQELVTFARIISRQINDIEKALAIATDFPAEEVSKLFYKANATFHSIFIRTTIPSLSQDLQYREIASDLENSLREITKRTGGTLITSNKLEQALDTISEEEDIYYLLTYAPENPNQVGKLKIKVKKKKHKLIYDNTIRAGFIKEYQEKKVIKGPAVKIDDMTFKNKKLRIIISNFYMGKSKKGRQGKLNIRIRIKNRQDIDIFDQSKNLNANQKKIKLSLNFSGINRGKYNIVVDVKDEFTTKTATDILPIEI
jgi:hypothetical protein